MKRRLRGLWLLCLILLVFVLGMVEGVLRSRWLGARVCMRKGGDTCFLTQSQ